MYIESLKQLYCQERKKLEDMWIFRQESKLRLIRLRKLIGERIENRMTVSEISGRVDISEETKDNLLGDPKNEEKLREYLDKKIADEFELIEKDEKEELRQASYRAEEFAEYLLQSEKVAALEDSILEEHLFPDAVYEELKSKLA